jgi:hypothetical protein
MRVSTLVVGQLPDQRGVPLVMTFSPDAKNRHIGITEFTFDNFFFILTYDVAEYDCMTV